MCKWNPTHWVLHGITSFRHISGCGSGVPDGFTRVSHFAQWISDQVDSYGGPDAVGNSYVAPTIPPDWLG